ncbi:MAG TPA: T9SS type A sorting domain-containing protein [Hymenobacter sp.]
MMTLLRTYRRLVLPALLLMAGMASGQAIPSSPISADPARARYAPSAAQRAQHRGMAALALPFFDDFTTPLEGPPKPQNWEPTGGALVSNRLALRPLTRGAATLDGLRANGQSYSGAINSAYGTIDSLVSQPIDLGGLTASDQVALSFAWQAGSIVGVPNRNTDRTPVQLELFAKTNGNVWESVWVKKSEDRKRTGFRQVVILLTQEKYLHPNFQFMFVASGNTSDNSDAWSVDYILLDRGRSRGLADTTFADIATSAGVIGRSVAGGMSSPLRRFSAMPVWQFNAASPPTSELNPRLGVNLSNLNAGPLPIPIDVLGTVRVRPAGPSLGSWLQISRPLPVNPRQDSVTGAASRQPVPLTSEPKTLRYTMALNTQETLPRTLANDTIFRDAELNTYYAYDDGTAENFTQLVPYSTGQASAFAYRFDLNQPDYVRGLRLYPVFTASDLASRSVTISVWEQSTDGQPGKLLGSKTALIPNPLPKDWQYYEISFDLPVRVTGSFYVGYSQPSQGRDLHYGLDLNSTFPARHLWRRNNTGVWDTANFVSRGALMMRPVMTNNVTTSTASAREADAFSVYPNPAHGTVTVAGPRFARAAVLDAVGRMVWEQPTAVAGQAKLALPALPAGTYLLRLTLADGRNVGRRLLLE